MILYLMIIHLCQCCILYRDFLRFQIFNIWKLNEWFHRLLRLKMNVSTESLVDSRHLLVLYKQIALKNKFKKISSKKKRNINKTRKKNFLLHLFSQGKRNIHSQFSSSPMKLLFMFLKIQPIVRHQELLEQTFYGKRCIFFPLCGRMCLQIIVLKNTN